MICKTQISYGIENSSNTTCHILKMQNFIVFENNILILNFMQHVLIKLEQGHVYHSVSITLSFTTLSKCLGTEETICCNFKSGKFSFLAGWMISASQQFGVFSVVFFSHNVSNIFVCEELVCRQVSLAPALFKNQCMLL